MRRFVPTLIAAGIALAAATATLAPVAATASTTSARNCIYRVVASPGAYLNSSGVFYFENNGNELWGKGPASLYSYTYHVWGNMSAAAVRIESCDP